MQTKRSGWNLHAPIYTTIWTMSFGVTRQQYRWKHTNIINCAIGNKKKSPGQNLVQNIRFKVHVWGGISRKGAAAVCIFKESWLLHYTATFLKGHFYRLYEKSFILPTFTVLCKTMTQSTHLVLLKSISPRKTSTGGVLHLNPQT